jgi:hypothetical protein
MEAHMYLTLPNELCYSILDRVSTRSSLLNASLVCHTWRDYLLPRLFEAITIFIERGPWEHPSCLESRELAVIAPHVRRVRLSSTRNSAHPQESWTYLVNTNGDIDLLHSILSLFENLSHLKIDFIKFRTPRHAYSIVQAAGRRLTHFELNDLEVFPDHGRASWLEESPERIIQPLDLAAVDMTVSMANSWPLDFLKNSPSISSIRHLHLTHDAPTHRRSPGILHSTWQSMKKFLAHPDCAVTDLEVNNFVARIGNSRLTRNPLGLTSATVVRFSMTARTIRKAEHALHVFELSRFSVLTHVTLRFSLEAGDEDLPQYSLDARNLEVGLIRSYPCLQDVIIITPDNGGRMDELETRSGFLRGCRAKHILSTRLESDVLVDLAENA